MMPNKPKQSAADTSFAVFCRIKREIEHLEWSVKVSPDNVQALTKTEILLQSVQQLKTKLEQEIDLQTQKDI